ISARPLPARPSPSACSTTGRSSRATPLVPRQAPGDRPRHPQEEGSRPRDPAPRPLPRQAVSSVDNDGLSLWPRLACCRPHFCLDQQARRHIHRPQTIKNKITTSTSTSIFIFSRSFLLSLAS
ncbi:uncharacterized protein ACA1_160890, partial [Acanthamoeba castellanii str. Neff]